MNKSRVHIIKRETGWAVKREGAQKASRVFGTKNDAKINTESYREKGHDIIVHKKDGTIEKWLKAY
jgi:phosphoglucomutase